MVLTAVLVAGTGSYLTPRLIQASQINLNTNTEPRSLSDIINFTQKSNLVESQITPLSLAWEQALRTVNRYIGTSQVYKEGCTKYNCSGGPPVPTDFVTATINVGTTPLGIGVNAITNRVYVANYGQNSVSVINGTSNTVFATITVDSGPDGVGVNPNTNRVYVADEISNDVSVIDGGTNTVVATITVGSNPTGVGVNPTTNRIFVANSGSASISVIDGGTNTVLTTIGAGAQYPLGVGVNPSTNRVYVADEISKEVTVIDGGTNTVVAVITGLLYFPTGIGVNPITNLVYVNTLRSPYVYVIDGGTNTVIGYVAVAGFNGVGVDPTTNLVYVTDAGSGVVQSSVAVIDGSTETVVGGVTIGNGGSLQIYQLVGVGVNPITNRVYVANSGEGSVSVIDHREEIREACLAALANCLVVTSTGTLFPGTLQQKSVNLVAVSLRTNETKTGTQMALTVVCDNLTTSLNQQCLAFYVDGNVWGPGQTDLSKSPFIIQNAEPYFYLQFHWWDFANSRIVAWGTWWYGTASNPNWYWGVYWWWRTYVNYYIGIPYIPWWWWTWHWTYWRYWGFWNVNFQT